MLRKFFIRNSSIQHLLETALEPIPLGERHMKRLITAAAAFFVGTSAALAASAGFVDNTIHSTTDSFGALSFYVDADGSYQTSNGDSGSWTFDGSTLCFDDLCGAFDGSMGPGDSWEDAAWDGNGLAQISIEAGNAL